MIRLALSLFCCLYFANVGVFGQTRKPNIVFILTDDQDILLNSMSALPQTKALIVDQGITFKNAFVSSPVCCVSRASYLTGRYVHNHQTFNNSFDGGCSNQTWQQNQEQRTYAIQANNAGYLTFYSGKYLNEYGSQAAGGVAHIPKGWDDWQALVGNSVYYNYTISNNGAAEVHGDNYEYDYLTDVIKQKALSFLQSRNWEDYDAPPFLMVLAPPAAHAPFTPAPQYMNTSSGNAPRTPNWNYTYNQDKHELIRDMTPMTSSQAAQSDAIYRDRLGTLRSVDDMVSAVYNQIVLAGQINNTYFIYSSDHGFHLGQFAMGFDKRQLYETDLRIPLFMSGPGIAHGVKTDVMALNIDIAPTISQLTTRNVPEDMDGRSLLPFILGDESERETDSFQQYLVEYFGEGSKAHYQEPESCGSGIQGYSASVCDSWNNTYHCIRSIDYSANQVNGTIYCLFTCFGAGKNVIPCAAYTPESEGEYYTLDNDPWSLKNVWSTLSSTTVSNYATTLNSFEHCQGQTECNAMRGTYPSSYWYAKVDKHLDRHFAL